MNDPMLKLIDDVAFIRAKVEGMEKHNSEQFSLLYAQQKSINGLELRESNLNGKITIIVTVVGTIMTLVITFASKIWQNIIR